MSIIGVHFIIARFFVDKLLNFIQQELQSFGSVQG